jgi:recombination protein RecR
MQQPDPIKRLIHAFTRLPGIGAKTATRLAFFVLDADETVSRELAESLMEATSKVRLCSVCCNLTESDPCRICADTRRDPSTICVVESVPSLMAIEGTGEYRGLYHVTHGVFSPLDGVGPDDLHLAELLHRLGGEVREIIVATNPSVEGEATALYIQRLCHPLGVTVSRIASGVPIGSELEYADPVTLARALEGRRAL